MIKYSDLGKKIFEDLCSIRYHLLHCNILIPEIQDTGKFMKLKIGELYKISSIAEKEIRSERYKRSIDFANIALTIAEVNGNKDLDLESFIPWREKEKLHDDGIEDDYQINPSALSVMFNGLEKAIVPSWVISSIDFNRVKSGMCILERSPYRFLISKYACLFDTYKGDERSPLICFNINWKHNFPSSFDVFDPLTSEKVGTLKSLDEWEPLLSVADSDLEWSF